LFVDLGQSHNPVGGYLPPAWFFVYGHFTIVRYKFPLMEYSFTEVSAGICNSAALPMS